MSDPTPFVDPCDPVEAYIRPIRSVLFIDDQFPVFGDVDSKAEEAEWARALWRACTAQGWLCDIDNSVDWATAERQKRLAACDLLVLDFHLVGQDREPTLKIVRYLALSESPNLVVVYTRDPDLDNVLLQLAAVVRGVARLPEPIDGMEEDEVPEWSVSDFVSYLAGRGNWMATYRRVRPDGTPDAGRVLLEEQLHRRFGAPMVERPAELEIGAEAARWIRCGNLFLVVLGKLREEPEEPEKAAEAFLTGLEAAVRAWSPAWLACLIASSRLQSQRGSFRDDLRLPSKEFQDGMMRYVAANNDEEERRRRAREVAAFLLSRRLAVAEEAMAGNLLQKAEGYKEVPSTPAQVLHLNAFLCSEPFYRHHLRLGTVFQTTGSGEYWVCVTPACDMVPRESGIPWMKSLDPVRPFLALLLRRSGSDALKEAERGRHLFFVDPEEGPEPLAFACFNNQTADPNPQLEQMFAWNRARVTDGRLTVERCEKDLEEDRLVFKSVECRVVCQLRAPYAERLSHVVGHHLSRIGVNFLAIKDSSRSGGTS